MIHYDKKTNKFGWFYTWHNNKKYILINLVFFRGLPSQWLSIVGNNQVLKSSNRPLPLIDPSAITPTEILDLKIIVRPQSSLATSIISSDSSGTEMFQTSYNGMNLPKISHVARSNSLRCSSPPRTHREANIPVSVAEEHNEDAISQHGAPPHKFVANPPLTFDGGPPPKVLINNPNQANNMIKWVDINHKISINQSLPSVTTYSNTPSILL